MPRTTSIKKSLYILPMNLTICFKKLNLGHSDKLEIKILKISSRGLCSCRQGRIWSFHVAVLPRMVKKCTKNYNAHAQPLFSLLNLLFSDVPIAVVVVVFLNSLQQVQSPTHIYTKLNTVFELHQKEPPVKHHLVQSIV